MKLRLPFVLRKNHDAALNHAHAKGRDQGQIEASQYLLDQHQQTVAHNMKLEQKLLDNGIDPSV